MRDATGGEWGTVLDIVVDEYESPSLGKLHHLRAQVDEVVRLLAAGGFRRHPGRRSRANELRHQQLRAVFRDLFLPPDTERLLVYWGGHGRELHRSGLFLLCSDSATGPKSISDADAITPDYLGSQLALCGARDIVLVMDACSAGGGAQQAMNAFGDALAGQRLTHDPKLVVISAAASGQAADERALSEALRSLLADPDDEAPGRSWGPRDRWIAIEEMVKALDARLGPDQRLDVKTTGVFSTPFFPNPRYDPELPETDLERRRVRPALLRADVREHFMLKFRGIDTVGDDGYFFRGRTEALRSVVTWLRTEDSGMFVVTGPPGSGKSALLGRLAVLSDADYRKEVDAADPHAVRGAEPGTLPDIGAVDVGIHARGKDVLDCVEELAHALGLKRPHGGWRGPDQLVSAVGRANDRLTVLVDALDEARPEAVDTIAEHLLRPLADLSGVKVLVGTRRHAVEATGSTARDLLRILAPEPRHRLHLDRDAAATRDIEAYAYRRLTQLEGSPYALADDEVTRQAARRVARESESVFLMARLFTRALARQDDTLDLDGPEASEIFRSRDVTGVFAADLARYGTRQQKVQDLLAPLAWALGLGLPKRAVWAGAATALTGGARTYTEDDVAWVLANAGAHLIESGEEGQSVYRLYHQAYADHLRRSVATADRAPVLLYKTVLGTVPRTRGHRDWARANPYALKHLPAYAAAAGRLEHLVQDTGILPYADPSRMMRVLNTPGQQRLPLPRLYLRVWDELRDLTPEDRAAVLQLRAGIDEPRALPLLRTEEQLGWRVLWGNGRRTNFHGVLVGGPTSAVGAVAIGLAPDGTLTVAAGDTQGEVHLWDGASGELLHTLSAGRAPVAAVELTYTRGRLLLAAASGRQVHLWDAFDGRPVGAPCRHRRKVKAMAFGATADGTPLLATSARDGRIRLWDIDRGEPRQSWAGGGLGTRALALTWLPGIGDVLVAAHTTGAVSTWKLAPPAGGRVPPLWWRNRTGRLRARYGIALVELDGRAVVVGRAGRFLVDGVRCLDLRTGAPVVDEDAGEDAGDGGRVASGAIRLSPEEIGFTPTAIGLTPESIGGVKGDTAAFVTGGPEGRVRLRRGREPAGGWTGHSGVVRAVAGARNGSGDLFVVSGSQDGTVRLWNTAVSTRDEGRFDRSHEHPVSSSDLVALPDGRLLLATGTTDGTVWIWDGGKGRRIARCTVKAETQTSTYMNSFDGPMTVVERKVVSGHVNRVTGVSWVPTAGKRHVTLVSVDRGGPAQFWSVVRSGSAQYWSMETYPFVRYGGSQAVALTATVLGADRADGIVAIGRPHTISLWDSKGRDVPTRLRSGVGLLRSHRRRISAAVFVPQADGTPWLAIGDRGGKVTLWECPSGRPVGELPGPGGSTAHQGPVQSLTAALGSEGPTLISVGADAVRVWDPASRSIRAELGCTPVRDVAAVSTADGRVWVAVATPDCTVEVWDAQAEVRLGAVRGFPQAVSTVSMLRDPHGSDAVLLAVGHGRAIHLVELLEFGDRRGGKGTS